MLTVYPINGGFPCKPLFHVCFLVVKRGTIIRLPEIMVVGKMAEVRQENENTYSKRTTTKGKGLFAIRKLKVGDQIVVERPLICCQFPWNRLYKYTACDHCLKSMETAEDMAKRLSGNKGTILPKKGSCDIERSSNLLSTKCTACNVSMIATNGLLFAKCIINISRPTYV